MFFLDVLEASFERRPQICRVAHRSLAVDAKGLLKAAAQTNNTLIVVEEHYSEGGLGDAVLNAVANNGVRVFKMAVQEIPRSGKPEELLERYGLSASCIVKKVKELI